MNTGTHRSGLEKRLVAAVAAYVFLLHTLIVSFVPLPSAAEFELAASAFDICHHQGQPHAPPVHHDDQCPLVSFFNDCCGVGHGGLAPSPAVFSLTAPTDSSAVLAPVIEARFSSGRKVLAARPRGPPAQA